MKNTNFARFVRILGVITFTAVMVFTFTAAGCDNGTTSGGGGGKSNNPSSNSNGSGGGGGGDKLTVTNMPAGINVASIRIYDASTPPSTIPEVPNWILSKNVLAGDDATTQKSPFPLRWFVASKRSGTFVVAITYHPSYQKWAAVKFTNGVGTVNWNSMTTFDYYGSF